MCVGRPATPVPDSKVKVCFRPLTFEEKNSPEVDVFDGSLRIVLFPERAGNRHFTDLVLKLEKRVWLDVLKKCIFRKIKSAVKHFKKKARRKRFCGDPRGAGGRLEKNWKNFDPAGPTK